MTVASADASREPARDLYQLLGVARDASQQEISLAWRRRARDEHPDARRGDDDAPARFQAVAEAWRVLGDPGRRAAYDRGLAPRPTAGRVRVTVRHSPAAPGPGVAGLIAPPVGACGPPLLAGPVQVEGGPGPGSRLGARDKEDFRLALLAELVLRYRRRGRPW